MTSPPVATIVNIAYSSQNTGVRSISTGVRSRRVCGTAVAVAVCKGAGGGAICQAVGDPPRPRRLSGDAGEEDRASLKSWTTRVAKRAGMRKAKVALARKLAVILHRMLANGSAFVAGKARPKHREGEITGSGG